MSEDYKIKPIKVDSQGRISTIEYRRSLVRRYSLPKEQLRELEKKSPRGIQPIDFSDKNSGFSIKPETQGIKDAE